MFYKFETLRKFNLKNCKICSLFHAVDWLPTILSIAGYDNFGKFLQPLPLVFSVKYIGTVVKHNYGVSIVSIGTFSKL